MGSSNGGVTRGQLRPHFGRSPPFLVAALCVGLGILGVSYYSLSSQYTALESQLSNALQRRESLEKEEQLIQNQLHIKEEEFRRAKVTLEKKDSELSDLSHQVKAHDEQLQRVRADLQLKETQLNDEKVKAESLVKDKEKTDNELKIERKRIEEQIKHLQEENTRLREQLLASEKAAAKTETDREAQKERLVEEKVIHEKTNDVKEETKKKEDGHKTAAVAGTGPGPGNGAEAGAGGGAGVGTGASAGDGQDIILDAMSQLAGDAGVEKPHEESKASDFNANAGENGLLPAGENGQLPLPQAQVPEAVDGSREARESEKPAASLNETQKSVLSQDLMNDTVRKEDSLILPNNDNDVDQNSRYKEAMEEEREEEKEEKDA